MLGKVVLCTVLCLFVSQVVYSRPQEIEIKNKVEVNDSPAENFGLLRVTSCRSSLRKIVYSIAMLGYNFALLQVEILAAFIEVIKCAISGRIGSCTQEIMKDTIDGFQTAIADFANGIVDLAQSFKETIVNCILSSNNANYQLFLDSDSFSKLDVFKSS